MELFIAYMHRTDYEHEFSEVFSSIEKSEQYLANYPEYELDSICEFELDPE